MMLIVMDFYSLPALNVNVSKVVPLFLLDSYLSRELKMSIMTSVPGPCSDAGCPAGGGVLAVRSVSIRWRYLEKRGYIFPRFARHSRHGRTCDLWLTCSVSWTAQEGVCGTPEERGTALPRLGAAEQVEGVQGASIFELFFFAQLCFVWCIKSRRSCCFQWDK